MKREDNGAQMNPSPIQSNPNEYLLLIHPIQNQPVGQQRKRSRKNGSSAIPIHSETHAQVNIEAALHKFPAPLRHHIRRNRIHPHHHQRERNLAIPFTSTIHENTARKTKATPPLQSAQAGVQMRFTIGQIPVKCSSSARCHQRNRRKQKILRTGIFGSGLDKPPPRNHPQQHRSQRRNKAQRQIPAAVERKPARPRKQIQKPHIERIAEIAVLVPVRRKAAYRSALHNRRQTPTDAQLNPAPAPDTTPTPANIQTEFRQAQIHCHRGFANVKQKSKSISQPNLRQRVFKRVIGNRAVSRPQKNSQCDQQQAPATSCGTASAGSSRPCACGSGPSKAVQLRQET